VVPTAGLDLSANGGRFSHFIPWFDRFGVFLGLAVGNGEACHQETLDLLILIESEGKASIDMRTEWEGSFCSSRLLDPNGAQVGAVAVLQASSSLLVTIDGRHHRFLNRAGELVVI